MRHIRLCVSFLLLLTFGVTAVGQQSAGNTANVIVPPLVKFSGVLTDASGKPLAATAGVTFALYKDEQGGSPLWLETQNVQPDKSGHYSVMLGSTTGQGLPGDLFISGEARWVGVQAQGLAEQPRVLLSSVPYALKALDAETIGGKPASSFMLAPAPSGGSGKGSNLPPGTITGSGTADFVPVFTGATTIGNSKIFQTVGGDIGIGTTNPVAKLDVKGTGDVRDTLTLFPKSTHPTLSVHGTAFEVSSTGLVTFVSGQTFPGTGTVTSVGSGAGLTGGPITHSGTLSVASGGVTNAMLANSSLTVTANSPLNGGGAVSLGGSTSLGLKSCAANQVLQFVSGAWTCTNPATGTVTSVGSGLGLTGGPITGSGTLAIDTSVVPQLGGANSFTAPQDVSTNFGAFGGNFALAATDNAGMDGGIGVWGASTTNAATGVYGEANSQSNEGQFYGLTTSTGAWGDTGASGGWGVLATTDNGTSVIAYNNSGFTTAYFENDYGSGSLALVAGGPPSSGYGSCSIYSNGNLSCTGSKSAVVAVDGGSRKVALYAVEAPENWFEDFGTGQLSSGSATINLEPTFAQTVNAEMEYHVFLTPKGDCEGLYLTNETPQGFEVRELHSGHSNIAFDYRIVARRRGYETIRLADMTERSKPSVAKGTNRRQSTVEHNRDHAMLPSQPVNNGSRLNRSPVALPGNK